MEQRGVGKHAVELPITEIELEEVLVQHLAACVRLRVRGERLATIESRRLLTERAKRSQISSGAAAEVEYAQTVAPTQRIEQRTVVLCDVVVARTFAKRFSVLLVVRERSCGDLAEVVRLHGPKHRTARRRLRTRWGSTRCWRSAIGCSASLETTSITTWRLYNGGRDPHP
jgi:hypothetical protein